MWSPTISMGGLSTWSYLASSTALSWSISSHFIIYLFAISRFTLNCFQSFKDRWSLWCDFALWRRWWTFSLTFTSRWFRVWYVIRIPFLSCHDCVYLITIFFQFCCLSFWKFLNWFLNFLFTFFALFGWVFVWVTADDRAIIRYVILQIFWFLFIIILGV